MIEAKYTKAMNQLIFFNVGLHIVKPLPNDTYEISLFADIYEIKKLCHDLLEQIDHALIQEGGY